jgi:deoxyribodipyrimidine photo-lyase
VAHRPKPHTSAVWLRRDLRLHDHPALAAASRGAERLVVVFCLDQRLLAGPWSSPRRNRFLFGSLAVLDEELRRLGNRLVLVEGRPEQVLPPLFRELGVSAVHATEELSPFGRSRDLQVEAALREAGIPFHLHPGHYAVDHPQALHPSGGGAFARFTPFYRAWLAAARRQPLPAPAAVPPPPEVPTQRPLPASGRLPLEPGERAALNRLSRYLDESLADYPRRRNSLEAGATSLLSPYLRFGCVSARKLEAAICRRDPNNELRRQLAWREFFAALLFHHPENRQRPFNPRYQHTPFADDEARFFAWREGRTGFPLLDAAMRQLAQEGWIHNQLRILCASFLAKQLGVSWQLGERHFMTQLIDGDIASNNGNWQWAASIGADSAPVSRRLYNPTRRQVTLDPAGNYVRRWLPELAHLPDRLLPTPWLLPAEERRRLGIDYPPPVVDLGLARQAALARYRG